MKHSYSEITSRKDFLSSAPCAQTLTRHFLLYLLKLVARVSGMKGKRDHISEGKSGSLMEKEENLGTRLDRRKQFPKSLTYPEA